MRSGADTPRCFDSLRINAAGPSANRDKLPLLDRQKDLLINLVEASRRGTGAARGKFLLAITPHGDKLLHPGLPGGQMASSEDDIEALAESGLVKTTRPRRDTISFTLTPMGVSQYQTFKEAARERVARVEPDLPRLLESDAFQRHHPAAYQNWATAEAQLWRESLPNVRQIARFCREAMQALAASLVERFRPPGVSALPEDAVYRLRAVIAQHEGRLGSERMALLDALLAYWSSLAELVEREEESSPTADPSTSEDARSLVLQTLVVLLEVDRSLY
jgi:hypothetical protein